MKKKDLSYFYSVLLHIKLKIIFNKRLYHSEEQDEAGKKFNNKSTEVVLRQTWNILGISLASARYTSVWVTGLTWKSLLCDGKKSYYFLLSKHVNYISVNYSILI